jgi:hypothetical protein
MTNIARVLLMTSYRAMDEGVDRNTEQGYDIFSGSTSTDICASPVVSSL